MSKPSISFRELRRFIWIITLVLLYSKKAFTQSIQFDKKEINFGEKVNLINANKETITINLDEFINLEYGRDSNMLDSIADVTVLNLEPRRIYTLKSGDTLVMQVFSPGRLFIAIQADSLILKVLPLKQVTDYADIKNIEVVEVSFKEQWLKWMILLIVLPALAFVMYKYWQKIKQAPKPIKKVVEEVIPYQVVALTALKKLKSTQKYADQDTKAFQVEFTNILKDYLGKEYKVNSLEMTTDDLLKKLKEDTTINELASYRQFLSIADMVKFAKAKPGQEIQLETLDLAIDLITAKYSNEA